LLRSSLSFSGDVETTVHPFANKWQTKDSCDFLDDKIVPHPCQVNVGAKTKAEKICGKLRDKVFAAYATECARQGTILEWRYKVSECGKYRLLARLLFDMQMSFNAFFISLWLDRFSQPSAVPMVKFSSSAARHAREHARTCRARRRASELTLLRWLHNF
jgi:hypothetical protein